MCVCVCVCVYVYIYIYTQITYMQKHNTVQHTKCIFKHILTYIHIWALN